MSQPNSAKQESTGANEPSGEGQEAIQVVVGVDYVGKYRPALDLLFRLGLRKAKVVLANCASPAMLNPMYQSGIYPLLNLDIDRYVAEIGEEVLDAAAGRVLQHHKVAEKVSLMGPPASELARLAERIGADLIVVQSEQRSRTGAFFAGSVSRGLAIGASKSLLISKMTAVPTRPLRAVFATDHSAYAERAFAEFMRLAPSGIASVHVLSALDFEDLQESLPSPVTEEELELGIIAQIREKNEALVRQLKEAGFKATASFFLGDTQQAIQQAMAAHEADLLVLGAQGHGFLHRIFIGSTSLHQVVAEPHSILLLRPEMPADGEEG